ERPAGDVVHPARARVVERATIDAHDGESAPRRVERSGGAGGPRTDDGDVDVRPHPDQNVPLRSGTLNGVGPRSGLRSSCHVGRRAPSMDAFSRFCVDSSTVVFEPTIMKIPPTVAPAPHAVMIQPVVAAPL